MKQIITHSGGFHADEVCAVAMLGIYLENQQETYTVTRTRDESVISTGDYVIDVGRVYSPSQNRFDHHQTEGAGVRENGIPYASCGLIWKHFGLAICGDNQKLWQEIEDRICVPIDTHDNGVKLSNAEEGALAGSYNLGEIIASYEPLFGQDAERDAAFLSAVDFIKDFLRRRVTVSQNIQNEQEKARVLMKQEKGEIMVFDHEALWKGIETEFPNIKVVVYLSGDDWRAQCTKKSPDSFNSWVSFPQAWAGLSDQELQEVSGIKGLKFCHRARFLVVGSTQESVIEAANRVEAN